jgi:phosphate transport system substrate-binding protein
MMRKIDIAFPQDGSSAPPLELPAAGNGAVEDRYKSWVLLVASLVLLSGAFVVFAHNWMLSASEHILLSLYGSTTLGDELAPTLAEAFLHDEFGAEKTGVKVEGRDAEGHPYMHVWGKVPGIRALQVIVIHPTGSGDAFKCLAKESGPDYCDIGMSSRPINDLDRRLHPDIRSLGDRNTEHVIALDGIAVIVNPGNLVSQLSIPQLRAIYAGQIRNWREVGGTDAPIELYGRDQNSGTFEMFTEKVMGKDASATERSAFVPLDHQIGDSDLIVEAVMRSPNAIGYVSWPLIKGTKALLISDGSGPAIPPTQLSVVTEDYPICRRLLFYAWDEPGSLANSFIRYVTYKRGQAIVGKTPFVELTPRIFPVVPPTKAPAAYMNIASKYSRIGLSFHFSSAQAVANEDANNNLDNLADINVLRLRTFLAQHGGTGDDILLIGFADTAEGGSSKERLAHKRAESVATGLRAVGVVVPSENIRDFGTELEVASNDTPEGRSKNRRVEVWVRNGLL